MLAALLTPDLLPSDILQPGMCTKPVSYISYVVRVLFASSHQSHRVSVHMMEQHTQALAEFEGWMKAVGITWEPSVCFAAGCTGCSGPAWGAFAADNITAGQKLCVIPKTAVISIKNTGIADVLRKEGIKGGLGLTIAILYEWAIGEKSKWYGYMKCLPKPEYVPVFWNKQQLDMLRGTDLEGRAEEDRAAVSCDWEEDVKGLARKYPKRIPKKEWTLDNFLMAATWLSSRAFRVDSEHGDALVPLADVFNHKASLVRLTDDFEPEPQSDDEHHHHHQEENASSEGEDEDEDADGSVDDMQSDGEGKSDDGDQEGGTEQPCNAGDRPASGTWHHDHDTSHEGKHESQHHSSVDGETAPVLHAKEGNLKEGSARHADHDKQQQQQQQQQNPSEYTWQGVDMRLEIAICSAEHAGVGPVLEIHAAHDIPQGAQIHNTYGEHGDAELVTKYGFALGQNPFNEVMLDPEAFVTAATEVMSAIRKKQQEAAVPESSKAEQSKESKSQKRKHNKSTRNGTGKAGTSSSVDQEVAKEIKRRCKWLKKVSSLLPANDDEEEEQDPCCVMPCKAVNLPAWLLLTVLTSDKADINRWIAGKQGLEAILKEASKAQSAGHAATGTSEHVKDPENDADALKQQAGDAGPSCIVHLKRSMLHERFSHRVPVPEWVEAASQPAASGETDAQPEPAAKRRKLDDSLLGTHSDVPVRLTCSCDNPDGITEERHGPTGEQQQVAHQPGAHVVCPNCCNHSTVWNTHSPDGQQQYKWTFSMRAVLQTVVLQRLQRYQNAIKEKRSTETTKSPSGRQQTIQQQTPVNTVRAALQTMMEDVQKLETDKKTEGNAGAAIRAALTLRIAEQRMLLETLMR